MKTCLAALQVSLCLSLVSSHVTTETSFLSDAEIDEFLRVAPKVNRGQSPPSERFSQLTTISTTLHGKIRSFLSTTGELSKSINEAGVAVTTIARSTRPHRDHYRAEEARGVPVHAKTAFVFLESNRDVHFHHGDDQVGAEAGKLVVFDGDQEHFTEVPAGDRVRILGPFALLGSGLSLVGTPSTSPPPPEPEACLLVEEPHSVTLTGDFVCNCTGRPAAIEVRGDVALTLGGYTVRCDNDAPPAAGESPAPVILLKGARARVKEGIVTGENSFRHCIAVDGGSNRVTDTTIVKCPESGIDVSWASTGTKIQGSTIQECVGSAMNVRGQYATVASNTIAEADTGIVVRGTFHVLSQNDVSSVYSHGIEVASGASYNNFTSNVISGANLNGVFVHSSVTQCRFEANTISFVQQSGFHLESDTTYNTLVYNFIRNIGFGPDGHLKNESGIALFGNRNMLQQNRVTVTADQGIVVDGRENELRSNHVSKAESVGIQINGPYNFLHSNKVNTAKPDCILVIGNNTIAVSNKFRNCEEDGLQVEESTADCLLKLNVGFSSPSYDFLDNNADCGQNEWVSNSGSGFPDCTKN